MEQQTKNALRRGLGIFLVILGIAGIILPILPGWPVIFIGLQILGWKLVIKPHKPWREIISFKNKKDKQ